MLSKNTYADSFCGCLSTLNPINNLNLNKCPLQELGHRWTLSPSLPCPPSIHPQRLWCSVHIALKGVPHISLTEAAIKITKRWPVASASDWWSYQSSGGTLDCFHPLPLLAAGAVYGTLMWAGSAPSLTARVQQPNICSWFQGGLKAPQPLTSMS